MVFIIILQSEVFGPVAGWGIFNFSIPDRDRNSNKYSAIM